MTSPKQTHIMLTTTTASLLLLMSIIGLVSLTNAQSIEFSGPDVYAVDNHGPDVYVSCEGTFPSGSNSQEIRWIFSNRILTINGAVEEGESPKYFVSGYSGGGHTLYIRNAVKEDEGIYQCQLVYDVYGNNSYGVYGPNRLTYESNVTIVNVDSYLPECSIAPSTTLTQGTEATFKCTVGESVPGVNLELKLQRPDRTYEWLGNETSTKNVTFDDHDAKFVCVMTNNTFPTVHGTCSAGPIIVPFGLKYQTSTVISRLGPHVRLHCRYMFSTGSTGAQLRWIFNDVVMADNDNLVDGDPSRYSVDFYRFSEFTSSFLTIQNAVKEDEGDYQCQAEYVQSGVTQQEMLQITVPIDSYLPALNYPECSIETPSINAINETIFYNGTEATFNCTVGESVPNVNLELILQRPDGTTKELGNATVTRTITMDDNNAIFYCFMTSDTFLTVNRSCAAGPIVLPPAEGSINYWSYSRLEKLVQGITAGSISAVILTFITVLVILKYRKSRALRRSDPQTGQDQEAVSSVV